VLLPIYFLGVTRLLTYKRNLGSSVNNAIRLLDERGTGFSGKIFFTAIFETSLGTTSPKLKMYRNHFRGQGGRGVNLTLPSSIAEVQMCGNVLLRLLYSLVTLTRKSLPF